MLPRRRFVRLHDMQINVSGLLRNFAKVRRAALAGETVVIATRDGNLVLAAQPQRGVPSGGAAPQGPIPSDADLSMVVQPREAVAGTGARTDAPPPGGARRFVPRAAIADAARSAPRVDAEQFRADLDALIDPHVDG